MEKQDMDEHGNETGSRAGSEQKLNSFGWWGGGGMLTKYTPPDIATDSILAGSSR